MRRRDDGNAVVEFIGIVVAVMVPLAYVAGACWSVVVNQLALHSMVHGASRAYVLSSTTGIASARVKGVVAATASRYSIPPLTVRTSIECSVPECLVPGEFVTVTASRPVAVTIPLAGRYTIVVHASDTAVVDVSR